MNKLFPVFAFFLVSSFNAQVGISTNSPLSTLDVAGDVVIRGELSVGGTDTEKGNPGLADQVLTSQGVGLAPTWKYVNVPFMENAQYKLINTYIKDDSTGIPSADLAGAASTPLLSSEGTVWSSSWKKIPGLSTQLEIKSAKNNVTYQLQMGVELKSNAASKTVGFTCGIFKNDVLVGLRADYVTTTGTNPIQNIYTLNFDEVNSAPKIYTIDVACRKTYTSDTTNNVISVGTNINNTYTGSNAFALKSFFKIDVAEIVTYTN